MKKETNTDKAAKAIMKICKRYSVSLEIGQKVILVDVPKEK